jgi:hypothetical protein
LFVIQLITALSPERAELETPISESWLSTEEFSPTIKAELAPRFLIHFKTGVEILELSQKKRGTLSLPARHDAASPFA